MVRPKKCRLVHNEPDITYFKPRGVPLRELKEVDLTVEELEAMRLGYLKGMDQKTIAERMGVSQPTLHRLLRSANRKIAEALVDGKAIKIHGGDYRIKKR